MLHIVSKNVKSHILIVVLRITPQQLIATKDILDHYVKNVIFLENIGENLMLKSAKKIAEAVKLLKVFLYKCL